MKTWTFASGNSGQNLFFLALQIFLSFEKLMNEGNMIALGQWDSLQNVFSNGKVTV